MTQRLVVSVDGGGTKGMFMYLSVSKLFAVTGFQPDLIVGVSAGAIVGALFATGLHTSFGAEDIRSYVKLLFHKEYTSGGPWFRPAYCGDVKTNLLHKIYGDKLFKDVLIPLSILVDTIGGPPIIYNSWDPLHGDLKLFQILDATTAVPVLFPPVRIDDKLHIDGGTVANSPTTISYLISKLKFDSNDTISLISVGINALIENIDKLSTSTFDQDNVGILQLLAIGLPMHMVLRGPTLSNSLVALLLGESHYLRIQGDVSGDLDDPLILDQSENVCAKVWELEKVRILGFIEKFLRKD
jgi:NTE family protein